MSSQIYYKTNEEVDLIRYSCQLVGKTHAAVAAILKEGVQTKTLDKVAEEFIRDHKAIPSFKNYNGFPASLCISINEEVVHGIPGDYTIKNGDIVSIDCGVYANGFHGDSAYTYCVGETEPEYLKLLSVTKQSLYKGIEQAVAGKRIGDIGFAIQQYCEKNGFSVVRELVGHGVGRSLHEDPVVANHGQRGKGHKLLEGLVIAIEPMINLGKKTILKKEDQWTIVTSDGKPSAHFEHTIVVRKKQADILSTFAFIEEAVKNNSALTPIE